MFSLNVSPSIQRMQRLPSVRSSRMIQFIADSNGPHEVVEMF